MTVARQSGFAPLTGGYVMSPTYFVFTPAAVSFLGPRATSIGHE
ncbi:hypothetical protein [Streptomyces sp. NPDC097981]